MMMNAFTHMYIQKYIRTYILHTRMYMFGVLFYTYEKMVLKAKARDCVSTWDWLGKDHCLKNCRCLYKGMEACTNSSHDAIYVHHIHV